MAVFTVTLSVLLGICYGGLPTVRTEETMLVLANPPPLIDAGNALNDIGSKLNGVNHDIQHNTWHPNPRGFHEQELTIQVGERMKDQKDAYEDLAEAQQRRLEAEQRFNSQKNTASPSQLAQLKFELENAIASEYEARIGVHQANIALAETQKILQSGKIWWPSDDGEVAAAQAFVSQKEAEIAQMNNNLNAEKNSLNSVIADAKQTQQDINSINNGVIPPKYQPNSGGSGGGGGSSQQSQEDAIRGAMDVINSSGEQISNKYGQQLGNIAKDLSNNVQGKKIRNYQDAMRTFEQIRNKPNMKVNKQDQVAIANALNALDKRSMADALNRLGKAFGILDKGFKAETLYNKAEEGFRTGDWSPLLLELEGIALSGIAARFALSFFLSALLPLAATVSLPASLGFAAAAILTGVISSAIDGSAAEAFNNLIIPPAN